jgi:5-methylcytosine-specific restriction protein B
MALYLGKFSKNYPSQISEMFYAAGPEGGEWYGGIKVGDYVFPIFEGKVDRLWKVRGYGEKPNLINKDHPGVVLFDQVKTFAVVHLAYEFIRYKYFELDLNLLNKSAKSVKKCGFHQIRTNSRCPAPEEIEFRNNFRDIYITLSRIERQYNDGDLRILINDLDKSEIIGIQIWDAGSFKTYDTLQELYADKNPVGSRYSLKQLIEYAKEDKAVKKELYLKSVVQALDESGFYPVTNPIALYDMILVGRKKYFPAGTKRTGEVPTEEDDGESISDEEVSEYDAYAKLLEFNPNLILYGPPGTGKTYAAMKIVESFERIRNGGVFTPFETIRKDEGRVKFITFHQSYSYEEFIEGIRPVIQETQGSDNEPKSDVSYKIEPGVLMQMVNAASVQVLKADIQDNVMSSISESSRIWKVSLGTRNKDENIYQACKKENQIAIGWLGNESLEGKSYEEIYALLEGERGEGGPKPTNDASSIAALVNEMKEGDVVFVYDSPRTIRDIGVIGDDKYFYKPGDTNNPYPHRRKVVWIKEFENPVDIYELNGKIRLTMKTIYELDRINFSDVRELLKEGAKEEIAKADDVSAAVPYFLIIDEINRGNISKIFGELITLIEKDKRDKISCELPYSKKPFTLPSNIYIIGTMNTADRSIALLDTALRRRFIFIELEPSLAIFDDPNIIQAPRVNNNVDLQNLLKQLNVEIAKRIDRDHRIGHAYFLDIAGIRDLYNVWYYKILPLVMEYLYNDLKSVRELVGNSFLREDGSINFLSLEPGTAEMSPFEKALVGIYSNT